MATISTGNFHKPRPKWIAKSQKLVTGSLVFIVPTIKGMWHGDPHMLDQVLLATTITLPGALEMLGTFMADDGDDQPQADTTNP